MISVADAFLRSVGRADDESNAVKEATVQWVLDHPAQAVQLIKLACERSASELQLGVIGAFLVEAFVSQPNIDLPALLEAIGRSSKVARAVLGAHFAGVDESIWRPVNDALRAAGCSEAALVDWSTIKDVTSE
jgi:hypothetical protein